MWQTAAFATTSLAPQLAGKQHRLAAAIPDCRGWRQASAITALVITAILTATVPTAFAVSTPDETTSHSGTVLPLCPAGTHLEATRMVECLPCLRGVSYTATANRKTECFECLACRGMTVESPCNTTHNAVCSCPPGHYLNVDGGCTILVPNSGNDVESSAKSSVAVTAASRDAEGESCEKESRTSTGLSVALILINAAGFTLLATLVTRKVVIRNANCSCWKGRTNSCRRWSHKNAQEASVVSPLITPERTVSVVSSGTQTDERSNEQSNAACCDARSAIVNEAAEHMRTKETLEATKKELASCQLSLAAMGAPLERLMLELTSKFEQITAAVGVRHKDIVTAPTVENACLSVTPSESDSDSGRQVTDISSQLTVVHHCSPCKAEIEASKVTSSIDSLKRRIKRLAEQGETANIVQVILLEIDAFSENPSWYFKTCPTEAEDYEVRDSKPK